MVTINRTFKGARLIDGRWGNILATVWDASSSDFKFLWVTNGGTLPKVISVSDVEIFSYEPDSKQLEKAKSNGFE